MEKFLGSKILVVDDEYANIFFLKRVLNGEGYETISASSGYEALSLVEENRPDAILLDIMMPELSGLDVLKKLKENNSTSEIPVIMVSAKTESVDIENALDLGAIEYLRKPVDEVELLARLRTALRINNFQNKLKENLKNKEDFIKIVAHDLRTPFTTISGFANMLKKDEKMQKYYTSDHIESFNFIVDSAMFLVEYFNKLLSWSDMGMNEVKLDLHPVLLKPMVETSLMILKQKIDSKNISVEINVPEDLQINCDDVYFRQIINNLLGNAIKYTPLGGKITVLAENTDGKLILYIKDTGTGMNEDTIKKILSDKPVKSVRGTNGEPGTGLGLKICNKIITSHNFRMEFYSEEGNGTSVAIIIN